MRLPLMVSPCSKPPPRAKDGTPRDQIVKALIFEAPHFVRDISVQRKRLYGPIVKQFRSGRCATLWETEPWFGAANRLDRTSSGEIGAVHSVCDPFARVFLSWVILGHRMRRGFVRSCTRGGNARVMMYLCSWLGQPNSQIDRPFPLNPTDRPGPIAAVPDPPPVCRSCGRRGRRRRGLLLRRLPGL